MKWSLVMARSSLLACGLFQGLACVSFAANATVLRDGYGFTNEQYGAMFLPQVGVAIVSSLWGGAKVPYIGLRRMMTIAMVANGFGEVLLAASALVAPELRFECVLGSSALVGLGFGLAAAPMNTYPRFLFPQSPDSALVAVHTLVGAGFASGPLLASWLINAHVWIFYPIVLIALGLAVLSSIAMANYPEVTFEEHIDNDSMALFREPTFWVFGVIAVLYAFAEATFANWVIPFLREERLVSPFAAAVALSAFWSALAGGRFVVALLVYRYRPRTIWLTLSLLIAFAFVLVPTVKGEMDAIATFAFAGIACSGFFPLTISLLSTLYPRHVAQVSAWMVAALMLGVGMGSFGVGLLRQGRTLGEVYFLSAFFPGISLLLGWWSTRARAVSNRVFET